MDHVEANANSVQLCGTFLPLFRVAARYDCSCKYEIKVELIGSKKKTLSVYQDTWKEQQWVGGSWHKVRKDTFYKLSVQIN